MRRTTTFGFSGRGFSACANAGKKRVLLRRMQVVSLVMEMGRSGLEPVFCGDAEEFFLGIGGDWEIGDGRLGLPAE